MYWILYACMQAAHLQAFPEALSLVSISVPHGVLEAFGTHRARLKLWEALRDADGIPLTLGAPRRNGAECVPAYAE